MIRALFAAWPCCAARTVWKPVSPSPGTVVATSSTSGSAIRISSAFAACSSTCSEPAPIGGATVTWAIFSEPESMNDVGRSGTSASDATNSAAATTTVPTLVHRLRRTNLIAGSYRRSQNEFFGSPVSSTAPPTRRTRK